MRPGEQHGVDYLFVSKGQFEDWIERGLLLEYALVYGEYKGIPKTQVGVATARFLVPVGVFPSQYCGTW